MAIKVDLNTFTVTATDNPQVFIVAGEATEETGTITPSTKFYPFSIRWNKNMNTSTLAAAVQAAVADQKPKTSETTLKAAIVAAFPTAIISMPGRIE